MKKNILLIAYTLLVVAALIWTASSGGRAAATNSGNTGAPCETGTLCGDCHNGGSFGSITETLTLTEIGSTTPVSAYTPGQTYQVTMLVQESAGTPAGYGFQATALNTSDSNAGTWQNPSSNTQIATINVGPCGSRTYVEHGVGGSASTSGTFTVEWQAPSTDIGNITFYYIGNIIDGGGTTGNDTGGFGSSMTLPAQTCPPVEQVSNTITTGTYEAGIQLLSDGTVIPGAVVTFSAGETICLQPEFEVVLGADFTAETQSGGCN